MLQAYASCTLQDTLIGLNQLGNLKLYISLLEMIQVLRMLAAVAATVPTTTPVEQIVFVTVPTTVERIVEKTQTMLVTETVPVVVDRVVHVPVERIFRGKGGATVSGGACGTTGGGFRFCG